jgi:hypothetical protein
MDRNAPESSYSLPSSDVMLAIRRFSLLPHLDASGTADLCIAKKSRPMTKIMESVFGEREARVYLRRIDERSVRWAGGKWESRVAQGSSQVNIVRRLDFAGPGTTLLAVWTDEPSFLAGDGFFVKGLKSDREGRFLVMWLNSTISLQRILGSITITRGTWAKVEEFMIEKLPIPAFWEFSEDDWRQVEETWLKVRRLPLSSLMDQLAKGHDARMLIDDLALRLLGVPSGERRHMAETVQRGVLAGLEMLVKTMNPSQMDVTEQERDED